MAQQEEVGEFFKSAVEEDADDIANELDELLAEDAINEMNNVPILPSGPVAGPVNPVPVQPVVANATAEEEDELENLMAI